jgi:hypothetical protein
MEEKSMIKNKTRHKLINLLWNEAEIAVEKVNTNER